MIEVQDLTKHFGTKKAVDHLSFSVSKGEILGFLGPNGAGKSTTMRMLTGFLPPSAGTATIGGYDIIKQSLEARLRVGYLPENAPVYPDMSVYAYLDFCAQIRGFSGMQRRQVIADTIERCFLEGVQQQPIHTLSKGYKQRVCFAQSILHDPEYLILDEPTDGLDPNQKHEVRQMIRRMSAQKAIILSTHILDEVEAVCTRAIIISEGRLVVDETPAQLRARSRVHGAVAITFSDGQAPALIDLLQSLPGVAQVDRVEDADEPLALRVIPRDNREPIVDTVLAALNDHRHQPASLFVQQGRLDEVFRTLTIEE